MSGPIHPMSDGHDNSVVLPGHRSHSRGRTLPILLILVVGLALPATTSAQDEEPCGRVCLEQTVDTYMGALATRDPGLAPFAAEARYTENGQTLALGDGLWGTITGVGSYKFYMTDPVRGEVGYFGTVIEYQDPIPYAVRLKVTGGQITEAEAIFPRGGSGFLDGDGEPGAVRLEREGPNPLWLEAIPEAERLPRDRMIEIANGYFDSMEQGTSSPGWFADDCTRIENGSRMALNPDAAVGGSGIRMGALSCAEQFDTGYSRGFSFIPFRRFPVVDEERGLVLTVMALQHNGQQETMVTNGVATPMAEIFRKPYQFTAAEVFKIVDGELKVVEAVLFTAPYGMRSGWEPEAETVHPGE
jgi:hypothetical protein